MCVLVTVFVCVLLCVYVWCFVGVFFCVCVCVCARRRVMVGTWAPLLHRIPLGCDSWQVSVPCCRSECIMERRKIVVFLPLLQLTRSSRASKKGPWKVKVPAAMFAAHEFGYKCVCALYCYRFT